ncbi:MAG TPA: glycosyltransferase family 2 protein [Pyrinomonadaceae bacterium]|nr:glycosyltransferase family 2 protein [Pyrinomonadaceae bacterium]
MPKITALLAFRNEERYLPGFFAHLQPYVSEFVVFDDGSTDRSAEVARAQPRAVVLSRTHERSYPPHYFEVDNRRTLLHAALERAAEWVLCCDADERYELDFLRRLREITAAGRLCAFALKVRDLWDSVDAYRVDGYWGDKAKYVLFPLTPFTTYHPSHALHTRWMPPHVECCPENILDFNIYHLVSLRREARAARLRKFKQIDPDSVYQPRIGYDYLADESGLATEKIPPGKEFELLPQDRHLFE